MNVPAKSNKMSVGDSLKLEALREEWKYERERNISLELELIGKEMENRELQNENEDLREQLQNERLDWVSFASVVTNLLWKASDSPKVAEPVLKAKKKLRQLFQFSLEKLQPHSGLEDLLMSTDEQELELLTGLSGFIVNICGPRRGCALVLKDEKGRQMIEKIIQLLERMHEVFLEVKSQEYLKAIFLMILYNVSLNPAGFQMLKQNKTFIEALCRDFLSIMCNQTRLVELRIIHSLLCYNDCNTYKIIKSIVSEEDLKKYAEEDKSEEVEALVKSVLACYKNLSDFFDYEEILELPTPDVIQEANPSDDELDLDIDESYIAKLMAESGRLIRTLDTTDNPNPLLSLMSNSSETLNETFYDISCVGQDLT